MNIFKDKLIFLTALISIIFFAAIAFDLTPFLRGPYDSIFESHWPYYFINTFGKIWAPVLVGVIYILYFKFLEKKISQLTLKKEIAALLLIVILVFLFQISLVFFSRFGITVLFRRIAEPGINGYFTAAINIKDVSSFLTSFPNLLINSLPQHSRGDGPGPILLMYAVVNFFKSFPQVTDFLIGLIRHPVTDAQNLWDPLTNYQRVAAIFLGFFMHFLSSITVIPFYFLLKNLISKKAAIVGAFIWGVIPSVTFFSLIFDPFYTIFPMLSFLSLVYFYKTKDLKFVFLSGLIFSFGLFFTLSFLPLIFLLFLLFLFIKDSKIDVLIYFLMGIVIVPFLLLFTGYNSIASGLVLISSQAPRSYVPWLIYNVYDVFIFMGIPVSILFGIFAFKAVKDKKFDLLKKLITSYLIMFVILIISGLSKGETGRIWIPLMILPVGVVSYFIAEKLKFGTSKIILILLLVIAQCIILEEFWVPIW